MLIQGNIYRVLIGLVFGVFLLSSTSALNILQNDVTINKTAGTNINFQITIQNDNPMDFFNIRFKETEVISMIPINLTAGSTQNVTVSVIGDSNYNNQITLIGEYETTIGSSNITETIEIDYNSGFSRCNVEIIKGDHILWRNLVLDEIDLINEENDQIFRTIEEGDNYTRTFNYPDTFDYHAERIGLPFTASCTINVLNDHGLVHSLQYDDTINLNLKINYDPTTISYNFPKVSYTINYDSSKEDIFTIENTGTKIAKQVHLSGDWFSFAINDFDLAVGQSKNIGYTINPEVFSTNETNKTHEKEITITGNFNEVKQNFSIYIPYDEITILYSDGEVDETVLKNFIKFICRENPDWAECKLGVTNGTSGSNTTVSFSADTIKKLLERQANKEDEQDTYQKQQSEINLNQTYKIDSLNNETNGISSRLFSIEENLSNISISIVVFIIFVLFLISGVFIYNLIFNPRFKGLFKQRFKFHKGEFGY